MDNDDNLIELKPNKPPKSKTENKEKNKSEKLLKKEKLEEKIKEKTESSKEREITSITSQKRKGRYNIFIDGKYAFPADENIIITHMLRKGMVVSKELEKQLLKEDQFYKAYQSALHYLSYGLRSEKEIRDNLIKKEFTENNDDVIEKLKSQRLIDDSEYAKSYVRTAARVNRKGPGVISQELRKRGIDPIKIENAMPEYPYEDQLENVGILINKRMKKPSKHSIRERIQKTRAYLMKKGFSSDVIQEGLDLADIEKDEDEEYEKLVYQADKAWKRYARKTSGYELINKTKSYLYGKRFPGELINRYIEQKEEEEL